MIDAVNHAVEEINKQNKKDKKNNNWKLWTENCKLKIIYPAPSTTYFDQQMAFDLVSDYMSNSNSKNSKTNKNEWLHNLIFVCGRYEGIDERFEQYCQDHYADQFIKCSLGQYIVYGGEVPCMMIMEALTRLLPGWTHKPPVTESYYPAIGSDAIENPHYTRPQEVYGYTIPEILLSGHHKNIDKRRDENIEK